MTIKTTNELRSELRILITERDKLAAVIKEKERELQDLKNQIYPYNSAPGWGEKSLIKAKQDEIEESKLPILSVTDSDIYRILRVDDKWVWIKKDGQDNCDAKKYNKETGRLFKSRNPDEKIDAEKALKAWQQMSEAKNAPKHD
jgi:hypothetical protein